MGMGGLKPSDGQFQRENIFSLSGADLAPESGGVYRILSESRRVIYVVRTENTKAHAL